MSVDDEFDAVRAEPDPLERGRRATALLGVYQQRAAELARLRRAAVEEARETHGLSYSEIATHLGLTKGRISQIRSTAPRAERAFFGVGPVTIAIPLRTGVADRGLPVLAAEDAATAELLRGLVLDLSLAESIAQLPPDATEPPAGDAVVVCGPKSAPVAAHLTDADPNLHFVEAQGQWWIHDRTSDERIGSPVDITGESEDVAYLARHNLGDRVVIHVAGIHAIGSLGAVTFLTNELSALHSTFHDRSFSMAVRCRYNQLTIDATEAAIEPRAW